MKRKNYLLLSFILFLILAKANAQKPQWDSTYRPANYALQVADFRSFSNDPSDIIFLGNSLTARMAWDELLGLPNARNRGISGDITFGVLERLSEVTEGRPAKVFILIGINDISRNIPDTMILQNYERIVHFIKTQSPSTKIYFETLLPVNNEFTQFKTHYNKDKHILWLNEQIKTMGKKEHITVIDLHPHFQDGNGKLDKRYTEDGLHLNIEGYHIWKHILEPYLK